MSPRTARGGTSTSDVVDAFPRTDSGRLIVDCVCGETWYPTPKNGISPHAGSPYCPHCGSDFRNIARCLDDIEERHEKLREKYGTLNPAGRLLTSDELGVEVEEVVESSRAVTGRTVSSDGKKHTVTVELTFRAADFPEVFEGDS